MPLKEPPLHGAHDVDQPIAEVIVMYDDYQTHTMGIAHCVGCDGVTRIEACVKNGEYAHIPYLRIWSGDTVLVEYCQHKVAAVRYARDAEDLPNVD